MHTLPKLMNSYSPLQVFINKFENVSNINVSYSSGCSDYSCSDTNGIDNATSVAKSADLAIVFLGKFSIISYTHIILCMIICLWRYMCTYIYVLGLCADSGIAGCDGDALESEAHDRCNITFPSNQLTLLQQVYEVQSNTILVLINGGMIDISWAKQNIAGIIEAFYPGELGGLAIFDIIFGNISPAGKLPVTIYDQSLLKNRPSIMDMSLRNNGGITYRYYQGTPVYPFGFGLSYTNFTYQWFDSEDDGSVRNYNSNSKKITSDDMIKSYKNNKYFASAVSFVVNVTNIGKMASDCVVLGFVASNHTDAPTNPKLFDFQRVFVNPGQSLNVSLSVSPESITLTDKFGRERISPGKYKIMIGEFNNNYNHVIGALQITGKRQLLSVLK